MAEPFTLGGNALSFNPAGVRPPAASGAIASGGAPNLGGVMDPKIMMQGRGQTFDPLGASANMMDIITGLQRNKMMRWELDSDQANAQALKDSIDPQTGKVDLRGYAERAGKNPLVARKYNETMNAALEGKKREIENAKSTLELALEKQTILVNKLAGLNGEAEANAAKNGGTPQVSAEAVWGVAAEMAGILYDPNNPEELSAFVQKVIPLVSGKNPVQIAQALKKAEEGAMSVADRMKAQYGEISMLDVGGGIAPMRVNPRYGVARLLDASVPNAEPIAKTPTPAEMNAPTTVELPSGAQQTGPRASMFPMVTGAGRVMPGTGGGPVTGITPEQRQADVSGVESATEIAKSLNDTMLNWVPLETIMEAQREALAAVKGGGGTKLGLAAAKAAQTLKNFGMPGISDEMIQKLASGDLAEAQKFQAAAASEAILMMKNAVQGTGRAMLPEVQIFLDRYGDLDNDPAALEKIYDFTTQIGKKVRNMQKDWSEFNTLKKQGKTDLPFASFPAWMAERSAKRGDITYFTSAEREAAGLPRARGAKEQEKAAQGVKAKREAREAKKGRPTSTDDFKITPAD